MESIADTVSRLPAGIITTDDARRVGLDPRALYEAVRSRHLVKVRPAAFVRAGDWTARTPEQRHALVVAAARTRLHDPVFSHESAAAIWGLPLIAGVPASVHVVAARSGGGISSRGVVRHTTTDRVAAVRHGGVLVVPAAQTVIAIATGSFAAGLAAADHALRTSLVTAAELGDALALLGSGRGVRRARTVVERADPLAESPGESLSRARMYELRLPLPRLQATLRRAGAWLGRVDFWWAELRLAGEFDGRVKYRIDGIDDPRSVEDRVWDEKRREDAIRAAGVRMVRWDWATAQSSRRFAAHLAAAGLHPR